MSERLELAIMAYHDGSLDAAGAQLLMAALRGDGAAQVREQVAFAGLLAQAFTADDAVVRSVRERLDADSSASAVVRAVHRSLAPRRRVRIARTWLPRLAVAAMLIVVIGGGWWLSAHPQPVASDCHLQAANQVTILRAGSSRAATTATVLLAGDQLSAAESATLVWPDGSQIELQRDTQVRLSRPTLGPGLRLEHGAVTATIAPQRPGAPFTIATNEASVEVLGTRFQVVAGTRRTEVELYQGAVRLTRVSDGRALTLKPQEGATIATDEELVARDLVAAAAVSAPSTPSAPTWSALFPAAGLEGWTAQHGIWSNASGVVRGSDPLHGKARLISTRSFADLELTARLRISGVQVAEIQVGDYNWFVEVPTQGERWIDLHLQQRGEVLTANSNGVALNPRAGAGKTARSGPLGFYVMPGGTLEISDARIQELK